jgi:hypothetical protein
MVLSAVGRDGDHRRRCCRLHARRFEVAHLPHDLQDLYLAPVALAVDSRLEELAQLNGDELAKHVALTSDRPDWSRELRTDALLTAVGHMLDLHEWVLAWDARGLRVEHDEHHFTLGVPPTFAQFLDGSFSPPEQPS